MQSPQLLSGGFSSIFLAYASYLLITGRPIFIIRMRRWSDWWPDLQSNWFRLAGGLYIAEYLLFILVPGIPYEVDIFVEIIAVGLYLFGIWSALQKPIY